MSPRAKLELPRPPAIRDVFVRGYYPRDVLLIYVKTCNLFVKCSNSSIFQLTTIFQLTVWECTAKCSHVVLLSNRVRPIPGMIPIPGTDTRYRYLYEPGIGIGMGDMGDIGIGIDMRDMRDIGIGNPVSYRVF